MNKIEKFYYDIYLQDLLPKDHINYLEKLKKNGFEPKVIYDIGSCVLHWTRHAERLWPNAEIIVFDANPHCKFLYTDYKNYIGVLSNTSGITKKFYMNEFSPGGSSYYREIGSTNSQQLYPENRFYNYKTQTLDDIVKLYDFPKPDLVKMDVQGAERDILEGGTITLKNTHHLIMELPKSGIKYNDGAPNLESTIEFATELGWTCVAPLFSDNGYFDGDYGFERTN
ncbi:methyltransferase fkbm family protein [Cotonvirus japonicus]|uniref:Methyltransferase fkbm family protein n=1 Tax=Cotonvirus japonicus TaxID=2811091 RepID=A0ABM7NTL3_9VIRU|nr:methyltransferase fkbm family protein [Cotonvirus japonicus]BCS83407.1 methyltransferase fkbm family protein [Cotonvirus japonicus]